mmetsp:Transcript_138186/g.240298  ORF Transcript_138186/g.240298 Transcript_138186/m.240298 type:complete len:215 (+) Transcript_138186:4259-4903(+)
MDVRAELDLQHMLPLQRCDFLRRLAIFLHPLDLLRMLGLHLCNFPFETLLCHFLPLGQFLGNFLCQVGISHIIVADVIQIYIVVAFVINMNMDVLTAVGILELLEDLLHICGTLIILILFNFSKLGLILRKLLGCKLLKPSLQRPDALLTLAASPLQRLGKALPIRHHSKSGLDLDSHGGLPKVDGVHRLSFVIKGWTQGEHYGGTGLGRQRIL